MSFQLRAAGAVFSVSLLIAGAGSAASPPAGKLRPDPAKKTDRKSSVVIAVVNGRKITLGMVADRLNALPVEVGVAALEKRKRFLERLVQTELLFQEALRRKLDLSPQVQSRIRLARRQILIQELAELVPEQIKPPGEETLRRFYRDNRKRYRRKTAARISHIVLGSEKEARDALGEMRRGASFEEVARRRSIFESSRRRGGLLGLVRRGDIDRNLEKAIFTLPIGKVSVPIKTPAGWQIIRVTERRDAAEASFEEVKGEVKKTVSGIRRRRAYESLLERLRREGKWVIYPERLR